MWKSYPLEIIPVQVKVGPLTHPQLEAIAKLLRNACGKIVSWPAWWDCSETRRKKLDSLPAVDLGLQQVGSSKPFRASVTKAPNPLVSDIVRLLEKDV